MECRLISSDDDLTYFIDQIKRVQSISFDLEGVNLSRLGSITVASVGIKSSDEAVTVFIFDMLTRDASLLHNIKAVLKVILEDVCIEKIIHDCRQDADALLYQEGIMLMNVFDTSVYDIHISKAIVDDSLPSRSNLNEVLGKYDCSPNLSRDSTRYKTELGGLHYWEVRPLTVDMIESAAQDVSELFQLKRNMMIDMTIKNLSVLTIVTESQTAIDEFRALKEHKLYPIPMEKMGYLIGKGGSNKMKIEAAAKVVMTSQSQGGFLILGNDQQSIDQAIAMIAKQIMKMVIKSLKGTVIVESIRDQLWDDVRIMITNPHQLYSAMEVNQLRQAARGSPSLTTHQHSIIQTLKPQSNANNHHTKNRKKGSNNDHDHHQDGIGKDPSLVHVYGKPTTTDQNNKAVLVIRDRDFPVQLTIDRLNDVTLDPDYDVKVLWEDVSNIIFNHRNVAEVEQLRAVAITSPRLTSKQQLRVQSLHSRVRRHLPIHNISSSSTSSYNNNNNNNNNNNYQGNDNNYQANNNNNQANNNNSNQANNNINNNNQGNNKNNIHHHSSEATLVTDMDHASSHAFSSNHVSNSNMASSQQREQQQQKQHYYLQSTTPGNKRYHASYDNDSTNHHNNSNNNSSNNRRHFEHNDSNNSNNSNSTTTSILGDSNARNHNNIIRYNVAANTPTSHRNPYSSSDNNNSNNNNNNNYRGNNNNNYQANNNINNNSNERRSASYFLRNNNHRMQSKATYHTSDTYNYKAQQSDYHRSSQYHDNGPRHHHHHSGGGGGGHDDENDHHD
jgi:hypothetical protein